jgi:hypothetical protein
MSAPAWMKPEGISAVRAAQIEREWAARSRRHGGFNSALEALSELPPVADADEALRRLDMQTDALCDDLMNRRI